MGGLNFLTLASSGLPLERRTVIWVEGLTSMSDIRTSARI